MQPRVVRKKQVRKNICGGDDDDTTDKGLTQEEISKEMNKLNLVRNVIYQDEDHTYFSLNLVNTTNNIIPASFITQLTQPLISDPSKYHISVVSFNVSGNAIPLFNFVDGKYKVTLSYLGQDFPTVVPFIPYSTNTTSRVIFNYQAFTDMVNSALQSSFNDLQAVFSLAAPIDRPYITFNPVSLLFTLVATGDWYDYNNPNHIQVFFNNPLISLYSGFESFFYGFNQPSGKDSEIIIKDNFNFNYTGSVTQVYSMIQTYATLFRWNDILRIALTTNTLGCKTQTLQDNNSFGNPNYVPILASFIPEIGTGEDAKGYINYSPAFLTYVDLTGNTPLRSFDFQFVYITKELSINQIYLLPGEAATLLLLFKHKTVLG